MLNDAGGPRWSYEPRPGLLTFVCLRKKMPSREKKEKNSGRRRRGRVRDRGGAQLIEAQRRRQG
eukprot:3011220-Prymnesium_polylepis.2